MNKISIKIKDGYLSFNIFTKNINENNLNNTNVIDIKDIKFTENYVLDNLELVSVFLNLVAIKNDIKKVKIENNVIAATTLKVIKGLSTIEEVVFIEDKELNYLISSLLLENINIKRVDCYSMPEIMFYRFPVGVINTRCEYLFLSNFMAENKINTYSALCNKDKIVINGNITALEHDDLNYFFSKNKNIRKIYINDYSYKNLYNILQMLKENNLKSINIIICEKCGTTKKIIDDIEQFSKLNEEFNVKIKIKYSNEYKAKNKIKEVNIRFFRIILIIIIVILLSIVLLVVKNEISDRNNTKDNINNINNIIEDIKLEQIDGEIESIENSSSNTEDDSTTNKENNNCSNTESNPTPNKNNNSGSNLNSYVSPYYKKYDKLYNKLLEINSDTVGWLTVNNTNINYPIVQTNNNDYYLKHAFDKSKNNAGWIFVDYRNNLDIMNQNTIIYGHNILIDDLMFGSLPKVLEYNWYTNENNLKITFNVKNNLYDWQVFSIYVIDKTNDYLYTDFITGKEFLNFIDLLKERSIYDFKVDFNEDDKIITLSTCYENNNRRLVLHAKLIK